MDVHSVLRGITEASQPQLPASGPSGQPIESSHLARSAAHCEGRLQSNQERRKSPQHALVENVEDKERLFQWRYATKLVGTLIPPTVVLSCPAMQLPSGFVRAHQLCRTKNRKLLLRK